MSESWSSNIQTDPVRIICPACDHEQVTLVHGGRNAFKKVVKKLVESSSPRSDHFCSRCSVMLGYWSQTRKTFVPAPYVQNKPKYLGIHESPLGEFHHVDSTPSSHLQSLRPQQYSVLTLDLANIFKYPFPLGSETFPKLPSGWIYTIKNYGYKHMETRRDKKFTEAAIILHRIDVKDAVGPNASAEAKHKAEKTQNFIGFVFSKAEGPEITITAEKRYSKDSPWLLPVPTERDVEAQSIPTELGYFTWDNTLLTDVYGRICASFQTAWHGDKERQITILYLTALEDMLDILDQILLSAIARAFAELRNPKLYVRERPSWYIPVKDIGLSGATSPQSYTAKLNEKKEANRKRRAELKQYAQRSAIKKGKEDDRSTYTESWSHSHDATSGLPIQLGTLYPGQDPTTFPVDWVGQKGGQGHHNPGSVSQGGGGGLSGADSYTGGSSLDTGGGYSGGGGDSGGGGSGGGSD